MKLLDRLYFTVHSYEIISKQHAVWIIKSNAKFCLNSSLCVDKETISHLKRS